MKVELIGKRNDGVLAFNRKSPTTAKVHHFNNDDGHYSYSYDVTGTKAELDIVEEFCARLSGHHGKKNPYVSMDCEHQYQEVPAKQANKESCFHIRGKKSKVHPGLSDYKVFKSEFCDEYQHDYFFKGYPVELFSCDFNDKELKHHKITVWVHPMPFKEVPESVGDERARHYYVDPEVEKKLTSLGFKKTGSGSGGGWSDPNKKIHFEYKYPNPFKK
jgi:hypothetical protein